MVLRRRPGPAWPFPRSCDRRAGAWGLRGSSSPPLGLSPRTGCARSRARSLPASFGRVAPFGFLLPHANLCRRIRALRCRANIVSRNFFPPITRASTSANAARGQVRKGRAPRCGDPVGVPAQLGSLPRGRRGRRSARPVSRPRSLGGPAGRVRGRRAKRSARGCSGCSAARSSRRNLDAGSCNGLAGERAGRPLLNPFHDPAALRQPTLGRVQEKRPPRHP